MFKLAKLVTICSVLLFPYAIIAQNIPTIFGNVEENNPATLELLNHKCMQRLKGIDQSGPNPYFDAKFPKFSRYDHSLGVYALLKKYNVSTNEQIAGMLHDVSHTVFSHLADYIFQAQEMHTESYQDKIHNWFLDKVGIAQILQKYSMRIIDISPKNPKYTALEQELPDMNADRIEYNLHTASVFSDLDSKDIADILASLQYNEHKWYFIDILQAKKFAKLSTYYTRNFWGSSNNAAMYLIMGATLKYAMQQKILSKEDLQFGVDIDIVDKMQASLDPVLCEFIRIASNIDKHYIVTERNDFDAYFAIKMRGIDPLVMQDSHLVRLSTISRDFKDELETTRNYANHGIYLKFIGITNPQIMQQLRNNL